MHIRRQDIHIISRHSDLGRRDIDRALKEHVYNDKESWQKFLQILLMGLGIGFTVSGIVFFFAYNWADLHRFTKLGLTEGLIIATTALALIPKFKTGIRKIILTGAAVLVGVLFAVFGQIYQTGANAYDFFLAWTIFITLWVLVSAFAPLWLLYLVLINTTFLLYTQQVAKDWSEVVVCTLLFGLNTIAAIITVLLSRYRKDADIPHWFRNIVALGAVAYATIGIIYGIFSSHEAALPLLLVITSIVYATGIWYGLRARSGFFLSAIPFSAIVIGSAFLIDMSDGETMLLLVSLFIAGSVTLVIRNLMSLQKSWSHEPK